jgi:hypothetical protein
MDTKRSAEMKTILKDHQDLYVRSMGKALRVTAIFTSADEANVYMATHSDQAVVAEFAPFVLIANVYDPGIRIPRE